MERGFKKANLIVRPSSPLLAPPLKLRRYAVGEDLGEAETVVNV